MTWLFLLLALSPIPASAAPCETVTERPGAALQKCGQVKVLTLSGSPLERAQAMGHLMRLGPLSPAVVDYFADKVLQPAPPYIRGILTLAYNQLVRLQHRETPAALAEELDALAAGLGIEGIRLRRALSLPDAGVLFAALEQGWYRNDLPISGCTSVAQNFSGGEFIYGRNLDFAGVGTYDRNPLLTIVHPAPGSHELKHISFGADGLLFGGITGVNEKGISFAVHQNYTNRLSVQGVPMVFIGELVLRTATNLNEALRILERYRPAMLWTFVLTDLKTGEALAVETSRDRFAVRRAEGGTLLQTNHVMSVPNADEIISTGMKINSIYRMKKAAALLEMRNGPSDGAERVRDILRYQAQPTGEFNAYEDILKSHTIQTILLESTRGVPARVMLSQDSAPSAGGSFVAFRFADLFAPSAPLTYADWDPHPTPPAKRERQREFAEAFHAYFDGQDLPMAISFLEKHRTPAAALFRAVASYQGGNPRAALALADDALNSPHLLDEPLYIRQSFRWVKLASLLRLGPERLGEARTQAELLSAEYVANPRLEELAQAVARGRPAPERALDLRFDFFAGDIGGRTN